MKRTLAATLVTIAFALGIDIQAQDDARPAWQVTNFEITSTIQQAERQLSSTAVLGVTNVGRAPGTSFTLRINPKAKVTTVAVGGATATFRSVADTGGNLQRISVTLPASVAQNGSVNVTVNYTLPVETNSG